MATQATAVMRVPAEALPVTATEALPTGETLPHAEDLITTARLGERLMEAPDSAVATAVGTLAGALDIARAAVTRVAATPVVVDIAAVVDTAAATDAKYS